jgi:hypothetical protein
MGNHERNSRCLFLRERQELARKLAHIVTVESRDIRDPQAIEDREQQQWIFGRLSERFSLFDQQTCRGRPTWQVTTNWWHFLR